MSKTIVVKTQKEFNDLPDSFTKFTYIEIRSTERIIVQVKRDNSSVVARGNSSVEAWDNSSVVARGNSSVVARGNSSVEAWDNSSVEAWDNSSVEAWDNSSVEAWGNSSVVARDNSSVVARDNSSVVARGNSSVVARGNSSVSSFEFSFVLVLSALVILKKLRQFSIVRFRERCKIISKEKTVTIIDHSKKEVKHTIKTFVEIFDKDQEKQSIILFKSVNPDTLCDFQTGKIKYEGEVVCPDFDPSKDRECGGGLHLCATPILALSFNKGQLLRCKVELKDIVVYEKNIQKVRCRKVTVLGKCDIKGNLI